MRGQELTYEVAVVNVHPFGTGNQEAEIAAMPKVGDMCQKMDMQASKAARGKSEATSNRLEQLLVISSYVVVSNVRRITDPKGLTPISRQGEIKE